MLPAVGCSDELSANSEVEHDRDEHVDGYGPESSRFEPPLSNGRDSLLIEARCVQGAHDADLGRASVACDHGFQHDRALNSV